MMYNNTASVSSLTHSVIEFCVAMHCGGDLGSECHRCSSSSATIHSIGGISTFPERTGGRRKGRARGHHHVPGLARFDIVDPIGVSQPPRGIVVATELSVSPSLCENDRNWKPCHHRCGHPKVAVI